jgi:hypothetical protein
MLGGADRGQGAEAVFRNPRVRRVLDRDVPIQGPSAVESCE